MNKIIYVGPTIVGVAAKNTVYDEIPEALQTAISNAPYLGGLCIPISELSRAMIQIKNHNGAIYTLYKRALTYSAPKGEN